MKKKLYLTLFAFIACVAMYAQNPSATDGTVDAIEQMGEAQIEGIQNQWGEVTNAHETISNGLESLNNYMNMANSAMDLYNAMNALDNNECVPDFSTSAEAMMPTGCNENSECSQCYRDGIGRLSTVRRSLARMSCINMNTKKFTEAAISFGDNVSGIHGVMGLAWQNARGEIVASYDHFKQTYDNKYRDLMASLQTALQDISRCEAQFGMRDWYQRFGFMYFELMKEKYKRTD